MSKTEQDQKKAPTEAELCAAIFGTGGDPLPEHAKHMQDGWHAGFIAGYRRVKGHAQDQDAQHDAAINGGLNGLERIGCFECLEFMARKFGRTYCA
ncbi:hypothetical protein [Nocardia sp. NPDC004860]|uniref:hypothetical protein n=1 Tax=Nocardia sp. NPDC004860 TaxID=3154557 RepID=UPI0033BF0002